MTTEYPHAYKEQRRLEKNAKAIRDKALGSGGEMPPICGYNYFPRKPKNPPDDWTPKATVCYRPSGANTNHLGKGFCDYHEVEANSAINNPRAASQLQAAKRHAYEQASFFGKRTDADPHTTIMEEISRTASVVEWLEQQMRAERQAGINDKDIMQSYSLKTGFQASVWMQLYQEERKHLVTTCLAAIKAGIAERKVQIAEQQGRLIVAMMMAFIHDKELGLTPDQVLRAPAIIRRHMLSLPNENQDSVDPKRILEANSIEV
jgi:hypothetical protein